LEVVPRKKQILLFSATFNAKVEEASAEFLEWPVKVLASKQATVPDTITEHFVLTPNLATKWKMLSLLAKDSAGFVFARTRQQGNQITQFLQDNGFLADVLHANKGQNTRQKALEGFREGSFNWLVTTDVASRGLDIAGVPLVLQFGLPLDIRDYIHRTGRTGRAGQPGTSYTFLDPGDEARMPDLQKLLGRKVVPDELPLSLVVAETPATEKIEYERIRDEIRQKEDPTFKGAFHKKQNIPLERSVKRPSGNRINHLKTKTARRPAPLKGRRKPGR
jgi:ATP-dependent RNA helicase RhlE